MNHTKICEQKLQPYLVIIMFEAFPRGPSIENALNKVARTSTNKSTMQLFRSLFLMSKEFDEGSRWYGRTTITEAELN